MLLPMRTDLDEPALMPIPNWRDKVRERSQAAAAIVPPGPDRLALVRTLAWLEGGRCDLAEIGICLSDAECHEAYRFGIAVAADNLSVRLVMGGEPSWWPSLNVDPVDRRALKVGSADALLRRYSSNLTYRSQAQKAAVRALATQPPGSSLMASLPTGAGKSLLFQIAALRDRSRNPGSCVIVVTPTIALALDHERSMSTMEGLQGSRALTGDQPPAVARTIIDSFRRGEVPVLLLGPEAALRRNIADALIEAAKDGAVEYGLNAKLTHFFVDEAHIIESWGRGFRPDFQRLPGFLNRLRGVDPTIRLVLLSATLSPAARQVLRDGWSGDRPWLEIDARVPRYEHDVVVEHFNSPEARLEALAWTLDRAPRPAIVYTTEVEHAKAIHHWLSEERGFRRTALFTGETASTERRSIVDRWAGDELDLVVATSAFGMGVDKADVRSVVHACLPEGPARWYQEIGRAARDGGQGLAVLLFTVMRGEDDDVDRARGLAVGGWLTRDLAEKRWAALMRDARTKEWVSDRFHMTVDLDSVRAGLKPRSSDYNRGWNMALLTLLQRAGAIKIRSVSGGDDVIGKVWDLTILDNGLLDDAVDSWDRVFETRQMEVDRAREEVKPFIQLTERPTKACVTRGVFELIEPTSYVPPCGRCPACRVEQITPPVDLPCGGLEVAWPQTLTVPGILPNGSLLIEPNHPTFERDLSVLVKALASAGIEQFLVPDDLAPGVADTLATSSCELGLVLTFDEWGGDNLPARIPTALLLPAGRSDGTDHVPKFIRWAENAPFAAAIIAEGSRVVGGRRLDQWASRFAPMSETWISVRATEDRK